MDTNSIYNGYTAVGTHQDRIDKLKKTIKYSQIIEDVERAQRTLMAFSNGMYREPTSDNIIRH